MVNNNIQGAVPISGAGFIAKQKRNYEAGEYRHLSNVEIRNDGYLVNRRNIRTVHDEGPTGVTTPIQNPLGFIGSLNEYAIAVSLTEQRAVSSSGGVITMWAPSSLPIIGGGWHKLVGVFRYNDVFYWLSCQWDPTAAGGFGETYFWLHHKAVDPFAGLATYTYASLTHTKILTYVGNFTLFTNFFIQNDRLWISTSKRLYFSKVTDPLDFTVPFGGFFNYPDTKINYTMFLKDTLYVLCDNSIFALTYNEDPNEDAVNRKISDNIGGNHGVVHKDAPYFVNSFGVWAVNNLGVEQVVGNIFETWGDISAPKLESFEDYLIVLRVNKVQYDGKDFVTDVVNYYNNLGRYWDKIIEEPGFNQMNYNLFFINMTSGAVHTVYFQDCVDASGGSKPGRISDMIVNPIKDFFGSYSLFFMTNRFLSTAGITKQYSGFLYKMKPARDFLTYDTAYRADGTPKRMKPFYNIEIDSYTPDGNEYFTKKFRSVEIMGNFPFRDFTLCYGFDNQNLTAPQNLINNQSALTAAGVARGHFPARMAINQRAKSITLKMQTSNPDEMFDESAGANGIYDQLEISDIRLLWGYTGRGVTTKTPTDVT